jgi:hypothetical protein
LAKEAGEIEREQDLLYQLAVLAAEQGQATAARGYLVERVTRLERGSAAGGLREAARRCLEDFDLQRSRSKALT